jgi:regulator of protease activity HflC (stomatin/prohibitin superfamily)
MTLEHALTSRDQINSGLRGTLDEATGKWGIRVNRVELKGIDPPPTIIDAMEKQMRAERDKRAVILTAEGERQSAILTAEGDKQAQILTAEGLKQAQILSAQGDRQAAILRAQGEGQAILTVFQAIHDGNPDQKLLSYQYLQMLPKIAEGENVSTWIIPAEVTKALGTLGGTFGKIPADGGGSKKRVDLDEPVVADETEDADTAAAVEAALKAAKDAEGPGGGLAGPGQTGPSAEPPAAEEPPKT